MSSGMPMISVTKERHESVKTLAEILIARPRHPPPATGPVTQTQTAESGVRDRRMSIKTN